MGVMVIIGLIQYFTGSLGQVVNPPALQHDGPFVAISTFLILKAFASGTTALTGVEAISNGITAFKEPRTKNAGQALMMMSVILGTLLMGVSFLTVKTGVIPSEMEANISQVARTIYHSKGIPYLITVASTMIILVMAANTALRIIRDSVPCWDGMVFAAAVCMARIPPGFPRALCFWRNGDFVMWYSRLV